MRENRSMPKCTVIPELGYEDVDRAIDWLCGAFGFELRLRIGNHRAQLEVGDGAIVLRQLPMAEVHDTVDPARTPYSVMVRVDDVQDHHRRAAAYGAAILREPTDYPFGERQYSCRDVGGHIWTFSESIADLAPEEWGGIGYGSA